MYDNPTVIRGLNYSISNDVDKFLTLPEEAKSASVPLMPMEYSCFKAFSNTGRVYQQSCLFDRQFG